MSDLPQTPDFDLDEDLFDFAGVVRDSDPTDPEEDLDEIFASFRDFTEEEDLLAVPSAPSARVAQPLPAATLERDSLVAEIAAPFPSTAHAPSPGPVPPAPTPSRAPQAASAAREPAPAPRGQHLSRGVVAIALAVTVLNAALAVVVLGRRGEPSVEHRSAPEVTAPAAALAAPPRPEEAHLPDPERVGVVHAHPVLDQAREEISRGEYASARQRVYGLLAIIDRLDDPRRSALEADCQFLIAQSLHLEALARMEGPR